MRWFRAQLDLTARAMLKRSVEPAAPFAPDTALPCVVCPSPNHGDRRGRGIDAIILHYTGMPTAAGALKRLCDPEAQVSSHYLIDEGGVLFQLVPEARRAWHAGRSYWRGERDMNSVSIGIEIANAGHDGGLPPYPDSQIAAVIGLCGDIIRRRAIPANRVLAHSDIAPGRKIDPGEHFPWERLAQAGIGVAPPIVSALDAPSLAIGARGSCIAALRKALQNWGFDATDGDTYDKGVATLIAAFQLHFRTTNADGVADAETVARLHALNETHADNP